MIQTCAQLWAYRAASRESTVRLRIGGASISNDASKLTTKVWEDDELYQAGIAFCAMQKSVGLGQSVHTTRNETMIPIEDILWLESLLDQFYRNQAK
jgi:hypothetical protein